jgi:hypothetical protein
MNCLMLFPKRIHTLCSRVFRVGLKVREGRRREGSIYTTSVEKLESQDPDQCLGHGKLRGADDSI